MGLFTKLFGTRSDREIKHIQPTVDKILRLEEEYKNLSEEAEKIIEGRGFYSWREGTDKLPVIADSASHFIKCAMPIISEGDGIGCVASVADSGAPDRVRDGVGNADAEAKLIQAAAGFLGRHTEA